MAIVSAIFPASRNGFPLCGRGQARGHELDFEAPGPMLRMERLERESRLEWGVFVQKRPGRIPDMESQSGGVYDQSVLLL